MKVKVGLIGPRRRNYGIGHHIAKEVLNHPRSELIALMATNKESQKKAVMEVN